MGLWTAMMELVLGDPDDEWGENDPLIRDDVSW